MTLRKKIRGVLVRILDKLLLYKEPSWAIAPTMRDGQTYDCSTCGACCTRFSVQLFDCDTVDKEDVVPYWDGEYMKGTVGKCPAESRCVYLVGVVGYYARCGSYWSRPYVCQVFQNGSHYCRLARSQHGLPVLDHYWQTVPTYLVHRSYKIQKWLRNYFGEK